MLSISSGLSAPAAFFLLINAVAQSPAGSGRTLIRAAHVLDVRTGHETATKAIVVSGDRILALAPTASVAVAAGDPLMDIATLQDVQFVMKSGQVYKNEVK